MISRPSKDSLALLVAVIAAVTSLASAVLGTWRAHRIEREKWEQTKKDDAVRQRNLAIAEFARDIAACGQETSWFLSKAVYSPDQFSQDDIAAYDASIKPRLSQVVGSLFVVAAHDRQAYESLLPLSKQFYEIDGAATKASAKFRASPAAGLEQFKQLAPSHEAWLLALPDKIAAVISSR